LLALVVFFPLDADSGKTNLLYPIKYVCFSIISEEKEVKAHATMGSSTLAPMAFNVMPF
jgi:hypothetical protein